MQDSEASLGSSETVCDSVVEGPTCSSKLEQRTVKECDPWGINVGATDSTEMEQRTIKKRDLWAMGVGAVISGDFFGWQVTLGNGFGSGLMALCFATLLYMVLSASVAEVASIPWTGAGPCQFAKVCFGRRIAFVTGLAEVLKCVVVQGVIVVGIGGYLAEITATSAELAPAWWLGFIAVFTALNIGGVEMSKNFQLVITVVACMMLGIFYVGAMVKGTDFTRYALGNKGLWQSASIEGVWAVSPFALWFYLGIEELPLATDITVNPKKNIPRGLSASYVTLVVLAFATFLISSSIPPGAEGMAKTSYPLLVGYLYIFGNTETTRWCCLVLVIGLIASLHSFIFATGQLIAQMAHDGYLPRCLNRRTESIGRPFVAIIGGGVLSYLITITLYVVTGQNGDRMGAITINMCLFCTTISYIVQLSCFLWLRFKFPNEGRDFCSPFGVVGALVAMLLCMIVLGAILHLPTQDITYFYGLAMSIVILLVGAIVRFVTWGIPEQNSIGTSNDLCVSAA